MTKIIVAISSAIEAITGVALLVAPALFGGLLLGVGLSSSGIAVARVTGLGLLSLGVACWPAKSHTASQAIRALFTYNLLAAIYFCYLKISGSFTTNVLWLAFALHGLLAILLARPAYQGTGKTQQLKE